MDDYKLGFWNWCRENHPEIIREYYNDMKNALSGAEKELQEFDEINY